MTARSIAIVQARMGSTRLPGKVLLPLIGEPILGLVMRRSARAMTVHEVVVATTTLPEDDRVVELAEANGWPVERGSESDLLDRYLGAARAHDAQVIVRITADCPLIDPVVIDRVVEAFRASGVDYASNVISPRTYPRGLDVEVIRRDALERAGIEDRDPAWREHVTPYIYRHPERFELLRVPADEDHSDQRWSVDTAEDYTLMTRIYEALGRDDASWEEALAVVEANPAWGNINRDVVQRLVPSGGDGD
ncbi:MAG: cytidylyltransferase domain-containing protein [Chloroflexota bacterium]